MSRLLQVAYQQLMTQATTPALALAQWIPLLVVPLLLHYYASSSSSQQRRGGEAKACRLGQLTRQIAKIKERITVYYCYLLLMTPACFSQDPSGLLPWLRHWRRRRRGNKQQLQLPPSPPGLPVIGHLHLVGELPHVSLRDLSTKHGSSDGLLFLRLGSVPTLILSSPVAAEAIMRTHDQVFASRPSSTISNDLLYGSSDIVFCPYGEHWRQIKKLVTTHLFTVKKVNSYGRARKEEVSLVMDKIGEAAIAGTAVDINVVINTFTNDVVGRVVSGKFFRAHGWNKLFRELVEIMTSLFGGFNLEDYFPGLARSLGFFSRRILRNKAYEAHKRWDELLETILTNHERRDSIHLHDEGDFVDVLLSVQKEYGMTRDHIKAILIDMFGAGPDTSALVLELAMAELMRNPQKMAKLQEEIRKHTPEGQKMVEEEDLPSMSYLRAVVKETLRLHPPGPLLVPRLSMADCVVHGCHVPSGTRIIVNAWAIGRDPESWEKPEEFMPERFMDGGSAAGVDFKGNHFQFLPFGAGRRICPGLNFGMATVEIMLANLIYCFDWQLPMGMEEKDIDLTEVFGVTVHLKEKLMLVPKLPAGAAAPATARH